MADLERLGFALRFLRTQIKKKQKEVARQAGVTSSMLSAYERGRAKPSLDNLQNILEALEADFKDLVQALEMVESMKQSAHPKGAGLPEPSELLDPRATELVERMGRESQPETEQKDAWTHLTLSLHHWLRFMEQVSR